MNKREFMGHYERMPVREIPPPGYSRLAGAPATLCPCGCGRRVKPDERCPRLTYYSDACRKKVRSARAKAKRARQQASK